ncbi:MAG: DsrE/DsrF/TusD sulfur relay family protein [Promethearchaeota archaeon]|jgi:sulfur relay (sulfurtransferase) complex TusBCD TusD component (DsrE family)
MTKYVFFISTEPYKYQAVDTLVEMGKAVLRKGNEISGIFFFGTGVYNLKKEISCGTSIRNIPEKIEKFSTENNIPVAGCSTWVSITGLKEPEFIEGATEEGLGDFSNWAINADKMIVFGTGG